MVPSALPKIASVSPSPSTSAEDVSLAVESGFQCGDSDHHNLRCSAADVEKMRCLLERFYPGVSFVADTEEKPCFIGSGGKSFGFVSATRDQNDSSAFRLDALDPNAYYSKYYTVEVWFRRDRIDTPKFQQRDLDAFCRAVEDAVLTPQHKLYMDTHKRKWGWRKYKNIKF